MRIRASSCNFEPFITLARAVAHSSHIYNNEMLAYEHACNYYGDERVALQETLNYVENALSYGRYEREQEVWEEVGNTNLTIYPDVKLEDMRNYVFGKKSIYSLFIYWPEVKVSNEKDESVIIYDLFIRIPLATGHGMVFPETEPFTLMRTTYTRPQWNSLYLHSHVRDAGNPREFKHICLGTGPIRRTISTLKSNPENEEAMMLFFWELDKVVHVESLAGVPYKRLSAIRRSSIAVVDALPEDGVYRLRDYIRMSSTKKYVKDFLTSFFLSEEIPFAFRDGKYILGCSFMEFAVLITNYYKKWIDTYVEAVNKSIMQPYRESYPSFSMKVYYIKDNQIWSKNGVTESRRWPSSSRPFKFNDRAFAYTLIETEGGRDYTECKLLNLKFVSSVLSFILTAVNIATSFSYEETNKEETDIWDEQYKSAVSRDNRGAGGFYAIAKGSTSACD